MPVDKKLLNKILGLGKEAYAPPSPAPGMPGMDPTMMDPAMMAAGGQAPAGGAPMPAGGGAAPMDPASMGMPMPAGDPMAAAGGAPGMDPSMVQGLPPEGGGAPPAPGGDMGMGGMPIMLNAEDLMALFQQIGGGGGAVGETPAEAPEEEKETGRVSNRELADQVDQLSTMVGQLMSHFNITPAGEVPGMGAGMEEEAPGAGIPGMEAEAVPPIPPEALPALEGAPAMDPAAATGMPAPEMMDMGMAPMEMGMPKAASESNRDQLAAILGQMNEYR